MTTVLKQTSFRNKRDDCTITVQQFTEPSYGTPLWRYFVKYDGQTLVSACSDSLLTRPSRKWLAARF